MSGRAMSRRLSAAMSAGTASSCLEERRGSAPSASGAMSGARIATVSAASDPISE